MSAWRQVAIGKLPKHRYLIEHSESIGMLWIELWSVFREAHCDPIDDPTIRAIYEFAWWAVGASHSNAIASATIVAFFEDLPTDRGVRQMLPHYMTRDQFLGMANVFRYHLSSEEHAAFVEDLLRRRARLEGEAPHRC